MLNLSKNKKYVLACSGGSDSMALLDMYKSFDIVVAHVNYHARETSDRDEKIVREYCLKNKIQLEVSEINEKPQTNFEAWARDKRYNFFKELASKYNCEGVIVAHHQDDLLETYLLQKKRGSIPLYWGLNEVSDYEGLKIYRPFLNYSKQHLIDYCDKQKVTYGIDETNFDTSYARNKIRFDLQNYSNQEKEELLKEIIERNIELKNLYTEVNNKIKEVFDPFNYDLYFEIEDDVRLETLRKYLINNNIDARHFSISYLEEIDKVLKNKKNQLINIDDKMIDYSYLSLKIIEKPKDYSIIVNELKYEDFGFFKIDNKGPSVNAVTVLEKDFPLTIRNYQEGDSIKLRYGTKQINRFFIDRKISLSERLKWPIVLSSTNEIILVPQIGCNVNHYSSNPNMFVIK